MSSESTQEQNGHHDGSASAVHFLEKGDGWTHVLVSLLLLLLAIFILGYSTYSFVTDISQGQSGFTPPVEGHRVDFIQRALQYLSDLLFGVIVLELLSTILTYIKARNLEATIKDFLVVGLISSVRKILLVGAQSSLANNEGPDGYVKEAVGTIITIAGIIMLVGGLLLLDRRRKAALVAQEAER